MDNFAPESSFLQPAPAREIGSLATKKVRPARCIAGTRPFFCSLGDFYLASRLWLQEGAFLRGWRATDNRCNLRIVIEKGIEAAHKIAKPFWTYEAKKQE